MRQHHISQSNRLNNVTNKTNTFMKCVSVLELLTLFSASRKAVLARSQTSSYVFLCHSVNLRQTTVSKPFTFTANFPKEQLMKAMGHAGCFYRVPFIMNTCFYTKNVQVLICWSEISMRKLSLRYALA